MARKRKIDAADENSDRLIELQKDNQMRSGSAACPDIKFKKALQHYDDEKLRRFFVKPMDKTPVPLSVRGKKNMQMTLAPYIGSIRAELILKQEEKQISDQIAEMKTKHRLRWIYRVRRWSVVAASVFLLALVGGESIEGFAFKLPNINFLKEISSDRTKLFLGNESNHNVAESNNNDEINTVYSLEKIVEGYVLDETMTSQHLIFHIYKNSSNDIYTLSQEVGATGVGTNTEHNDGIYLPTMYGDSYYYEYNGLAGLLWEYNGYSFKIDGKLTQDQLLDLQESLRKEE